MKKVAYYKGCLASLSAKELDTSTRALAPKVGYELVELDSVTCCGAGDIHEAEPDYYLHLNARILAYAEETGCDTLMTVCNVCTLNLRQANYQLQIDEALRERVNDNLATVGAPRYEGTVDVLHFLWLVAGESYETLKQVAHKGLRGLKIAPFYGCQILRPSKLLGFEDPDKPDSLERIIAACGGEAVDYPAKIKCCGFPIIQAREDTALGELIQPIEQAMEAGADAMVTPCPLCHLSLDAWQSKLRKQTGREFNMPIFHLSQLIGVAAGLTDSELKFRRHVVSMEPVIEKLRRLSCGPRWPAAQTVPGSQGPVSGHSAFAPVALRRDSRLVDCGCARRAGACLSRLRVVRGGLAADARARGAGPGAAARRSTGSASRTCPTSISALARAGGLRPSAPPRGSRAGGPTSSPSPVTSSPTRAASRCCGRSSAASNDPTSCSGNHDVAVTRDPFSRAAELDDLRELAVLLRDDAVTEEIRGCVVQLVGVDPVAYHRKQAQPWQLADPRADLRILLCHFPGIVRRLPDGAFQLVLAGHLHAGQITLPYPGGRMHARPPGRAVRRPACTPHPAG